MERAFSFGVLPFGQGRRSNANGSDSRYVSRSMQNQDTDGVSVIAIKFGVHATESKGVNAGMEMTETRI